MSHFLGVLIQVNLKVENNMHQMPVERIQLYYLELARIEIQSLREKSLTV
jgi:hypothetical protein